jgi:hypothetical protein
LEGAKLSELIMINPVLVVVAVLITASIGYYVRTSFAMHDSTLDVNTWLASDNSTQINTIDLNSGPVASATDSGGAAEAAETAEAAESADTGDEAVVVDEETDETEETSTDEIETDEENGE